MICDLRRSEALPLIAQDVARLADELCQAGYNVVVRSTPGVGGATQYQLTARNRLGAFLILAPTEADAFRRGMEHLRALMTPERPGN